MMSEMVKWLNSDLEIHPVFISGIAQFQLVHIHPFLDGNGRTSRLLSTLCLYKAGYDFKRLFTISEYYDRDRPAFYGGAMPGGQPAQSATRFKSIFGKRFDQGNWSRTHRSNTPLCFVIAVTNYESMII